MQLFLSIYRIGSIRLTRWVNYCIIKVDPIESCRKEAALLRKNEYPTVNTNEFHSVGDDIPKLPAEHRSLPDDFTRTDPLHDESAREFAPAKITPTIPRRRPKKMLKYIIGTVSIVAVVLTAAVETGQMSWSDLFPLQGSFIYPPDFTYPSYTYTISEGNTYTVSFDDTKLEEYFEFLAGAIDETSKGIPKAQIDEAVRLGSPENIHFFSAPEGSVVPYSIVGYIISSEDDYTDPQYNIDPIAFHSSSVWKPDGNDRITVSDYNGIITYGDTTAKDSTDLFFVHLTYVNDYPFHRDNSLDIFLEIYSWGSTRSYDEILTEIRSNSDLIEEKLISCYSDVNFTVLDGSTEILLPLFLKVDVTPGDSTNQTSGDYENTSFTIPSYTYPISEGNSYRITFDEDKLDEYYDYIAAYFYRLTRLLTPERIEEYESGSGASFFDMVLDELTGNITVAHLGGVITSGTSFSSPFLFPIGKAWSEKQFETGNPPPITILQNGQERTYGTTMVNGKPPVFQIDVDLREDAKSLSLPWYHLPYNSVDGIELETLYEWGSDLTYSEIYDYIRQNADFSPNRSFDRPERRTVEFTVIDGSLEIYISEFLKIELINP